MAGMACSSVINGTLFTFLLNLQLMSLLTEACDVATAPLSPTLRYLSYPLLVLYHVLYVLRNSPWRPDAVCCILAYMSGIYSTIS